MSRKNNIISNKTKRTAKKIIAFLCAFLFGALSFGVYNSVIAEKDLNPDNLLKYEYYGDGNGKGLTTEWEKGSLKAKWNDNGSFVLTGKYEDKDKADSDFLEYHFATVTLTAGEYTFSHGNKNASKDSYYLHVTSTGTKPVEQDAFDDKVTFTLDETAIVNISFKVKNNYRIIYAKFEPVLVTGKTAGEFYAK